MKASSGSRRQFKVSEMSRKREVPTTLKSLLKWDVTLTNKFVKFVNTSFGPLVKYKGVFKGLEISCHGIPWLIGLVTMVFLTNNHAVRHFCVNLFLTLLVDIVVVAVAKASTRRRRPSDNPDDMFATFTVDKFSFPSGHATRAVLLAFLIPQQYNLIFPLPALLILWSACVCVSRVLMKRHHVLDVVGGAAIGWAEAGFVSTFTWLSVESADGVVELFLDESRVGAAYDV